jgi:citrate lyase beta subunit
MVRINPLNKYSQSEVKKVIELGADRIMLPMFRSKNEVKKIINFINGQVPLTLLLETSTAVLRLSNILELKGIDDVHIGLNDLHIDLIDKVNPFQKAFEVLSKSVTANLLKLIGETIESQRIAMTDEEAIILWKDKIIQFVNKNNRQPDINSNFPLERRMAEAIIYLKNKKRSMQFS